MVGLVYDNIGVVGKDGIRIDVGGALLYRGMGTLKDEMFTSNVNEVCNLLNPQINRPAAEIFRNSTVKDFLVGIEKIKQIKYEDLANLVVHYAPGNCEQKVNLVNLLLERKEDLINQADIAQTVDEKEYVRAKLCGLSDPEYHYSEEL